jgi:hypothetical protein
MSHSTHVGFKLPLTTFRPCDCNPVRRVAVGVGSVSRSASFTARPSSLPDGPGRRLFFGTMPCGVGQRLCLAIDSSECRTGPTRPAAPP